MSRHTLASSDAFVILGTPTDGGAFVFTCEHATHLVPPPLEPSASDQHWLQQHWGWDPGIEDVTCALLEATSSCGVFSRFSRLICDPNRGHTEPSWLVEEIDGVPIDFNRNVDELERARRKRQLHDPYHDAISGLLAKRLAHSTDATLLSMHSFTPQLRGEIRTMEIGVLYDEQWAQEAEELAQLIEAEHFVVARNAPYSGFNGLIYSAHRHGNEQDVRYLELEIRQDLIAQRADALQIAARLQPALQHFARQCSANPKGDTL